MFCFRSLYDIIFGYAGISGRESGSNKQSASKSCALSLVRQLFHLGVIEAFSGSLKKKDVSAEIPAYEVAVDPNLVNETEEILRELKVGVIKLVRMS